MTASSASLGTQELDVTFYIACLNEEQTIVGAIETVLSAVKQAGCSYEIIIVDDHSKDRSVHVVENYITQHPGLPICLVKNEKQKGLGRNHTDVAFMGRGKYYKWIGGSNRESIEDLVVILGKRGEADIILPYLAMDGRPYKRRALSLLFTKILNFMTGYSLKYYNGSALHKRHNVMRWHSYSYGHSFQVELMLRLLEEGATCCEVPTQCIDRASIKTKAFSFYNILSVLHTLAHVFLQIIKRKLVKK